MKTIRLLYPDWISGGLETYHFGANLLQHILPVNPNQPLVPGFTGSVRLPARSVPEYRNFVA